jgi:CDP-2,3-bis-(O-geranylgeranyl)-sn-glycerol synthase
MSAWSCALFLIAAFVLAGFAQTAWFAAPVSHRFAIALDGGATLRGRRLFGANKTLRGFVVMLPAAATAFVMLRLMVGDPGAAGLWPLTFAGYARLGAVAALGFMAGELPNSFIKRQLGIDPGAEARRSWTAAAQFVVDRLDSGVGMLLAVSVTTHTPALTWLLVLAIGPPFHWMFSVLMFELGLKTRPA